MYVRRPGTVRTCTVYPTHFNCLFLTLFLTLFWRPFPRNAHHLLHDFCRSGIDPEHVGGAAEEEQLREIGTQKFTRNWHATVWHTNKRILNRVSVVYELCRYRQRSWLFCFILILNMHFSMATFAGFEPTQELSNLWGLKNETENETKTYHCTRTPYELPALCWFEWCNKIDLTTQSTLDWLYRVTSRWDDQGVRSVCMYSALSCTPQKNSDRQCTDHAMECHRLGGRKDVDISTNMYYEGLLLLYHWNQRRMPGGVI